METLMTIVGTIALLIVAVSLMIFAAEFFIMVFIFISMAYVCGIIPRDKSSPQQNSSSWLATPQVQNSDTIYSPKSTNSTYTSPSVVSHEPFENLDQRIYNAVKKGLSPGQPSSQSRSSTRRQHGWDRGYTRPLPVPPVLPIPPVPPSSDYLDGPLPALCPTCSPLPVEMEGRIKTQCEGSHDVQACLRLGVLRATGQ